MWQRGTRTLGSGNTAPVVLLLLTLTAVPFKLEQNSLILQLSFPSQINHLLRCSILFDTWCYRLYHSVPQNKDDLGSHTNWNWRFLSVQDHREKVGPHSLLLDLLILTSWACPASMFEQMPVYTGVSSAPCSGLRMYCQLKHVQNKAIDFTPSQLF